MRIQIAKPVLKCIKCGEDATRSYRPDPDIQGIGMCKEHVEEIQIDIITATCSSDWNKFKDKYKIKD